MYGNEPNPGVRYRYVRVRCGDWWVEDPRSPSYNTFQRVGCGVKPPFSTSSDGMWEDPVAYPYLAVIEFNMRPAVRGRGSGIFLHAMKNGPTNGCVSIEKTALRKALRWLSPAAKPEIAIGTRTSLT
jgi:L,D-peptidoglycan transpeptidase YkuD (ErfK/YbiS/YcfS/YnhG family)